jgi:hypothetical protein
LSKPTKPKHSFSVSRSSRLEKNGILFTKVYLAALFGGLPVLAFFGLLQFRPLGLNEFGDFMAGAFGPLALFWLVLGFFQQGDELRNSVEALRLQADELQNSVDQQRELVAVTRESLLHERQLIELENVERKAGKQPRLLVTFSAWMGQGDEKFKYRLTVENEGEPASAFSFVIYVDGDPLMTVNSPHLKRGQTLKNDSSIYLPRTIGAVEGRATFTNIENENCETKFVGKEDDPEAKWPTYSISPKI